MKNFSELSAVHSGGLRSSAKSERSLRAVCPSSRKCPLSHVCGADGPPILDLANLRFVVCSAAAVHSECLRFSIVMNVFTSTAEGRQAETLIKCPSSSTEGKHFLEEDDRKKTALVRTRRSSHEFMHSETRSTSEFESMICKTRRSDSHVDGKRTSPRQNSARSFRDETNYLFPPFSFRRTRECYRSGERAAHYLFREQSRSDDRKRRRVSCPKPLPIRNIVSNSTHNQKI